MINFIEHSSEKYAPRTVANAASSDITFAFACDFKSGGEVLTKRSVLNHGKIYIPVNMSNQTIDYNRILSICKHMEGKTIGKSSLIINIAGNGIYTLKNYGITQYDSDFFIVRMIDEIENYGIKISKIKCGGQTGADESGAKAGLRLSIETEVLAPNGWKFRDINGIDISNEEQFKARFK